MVAKGQILRHEFARFDRLDDSYFQHKIGLINYAPYRLSMKMAVNRHSLWDFLAFDSKTRNLDWATDLDTFKSSLNYRPSDWKENLSPRREVVDDQQKLLLPLTYINCLLRKCRHEGQPLHLKRWPNQLTAESRPKN